MKPNLKMTGVRAPRLFMLAQIAGVVIVLTGSAVSQPPGRVRRSVSDVLGNRVRAQAELIEAQGKRELNYALAREAHAKAAAEMVKALSAQKDLEMKDFNQYWEKRRRHNLEMWNSLEQRIENSRKPMVLENARKVAVWERTIEGDLDRARPSIRSGELLNRMARQIDSATGLSSSYQVGESLAKKLAVIDDDALSRLTLTVSSINGPVSVSLSSVLPPIFGRWPYLFRDPTLRVHCDRINRLAGLLISEETSNSQRYEIEQRLLEALKQASNDFYTRFPPEPRQARSLIAHRRFEAAERYLAELERTIASLAETPTGGSSGRPSYYQEYDHDKRNAATLIQYMMRYGLEFGKASSGAEFVYDRLFLQFRDLARELNAAPGREKITKPIINLDLDELVKDMKNSDLE